MHHMECFYTRYFLCGGWGFELNPSCFHSIYLPTDQIPAPKNLNPEKCTPQAWYWTTLLGERKVKLVSFLFIFGFHEKWYYMKIFSKIGSSISILLLFPWKEKWKHSSYHSGSSIINLHALISCFAFRPAVLWPSFEFSSKRLYVYLMVSLRDLLKHPTAFLGST